MNTRAASIGSRGRGSAAQSSARPAAGPSGRGFEVSVVERAELVDGVSARGSAPPRREGGWRSSGDVLASSIAVHRLSSPALLLCPTSDDVFSSADGRGWTARAILNELAQTREIFIPGDRLSVMQYSPVGVLSGQPHRALLRSTPTTRGDSPFKAAAWNTSSVETSSYPPYLTPGLLGGMHSAVVSSAQPRGAYDFAESVFDSGTEATLLVVLERAPWLSGSRALTHIAGDPTDFVGASLGDGGLFSFAAYGGDLVGNWTMSGATADYAVIDTDTALAPALAVMRARESHISLDSWLTGTRTSTSRVAGGVVLQTGSSFLFGGVTSLTPTALMGTEGCVGLVVASRERLADGEVAVLARSLQEQSVSSVVGGTGSCSMLYHGLVPGASKAVPAVVSQGWPISLAGADRYLRSGGADQVPLRGVLTSWEPSGSAMSWSSWAMRTSFQSVEWDGAPANIPAAWPILAGGDGLASAITTEKNWSFALATGSADTPIIRARSWVWVDTGSAEEVDWSTRLGYASPWVPTEDTWFHVGASCWVGAAGAYLSMSISVNGTVVLTGAYVPSSPIVSLTGSRMIWGGGWDWDSTATYGSGASWRGYLSSLACWNRRMTESELAALYTAGQGVYV